MGSSRSPGILRARSGLCSEGRHFVGSPGTTIKSDYVHQLGVMLAVLATTSGSNYEGQGSYAQV